MNEQNGNGRPQEKVRVALIGVGNCANAFMQGLTYYRDAKADEFVPGLMHVDLGGYHIRDVEVVAAFDVVKGKVGLDLSALGWKAERRLVGMDPPYPDRPPPSGWPAHIELKAGLHKREVAGTQAHRNLATKDRAEQGLHEVNQVRDGNIAVHHHSFYLIESVLVRCVHFFIAEDPSRGDHPHGRAILLQRPHLHW